MSTRPIKILFNVVADEDNTNAQSQNAREIAIRLHPEKKFNCSFFFTKQPDPRFINKKQFRLILIPRRMGSLVFLYHQLWGDYDILFYHPPPATVIKLMNLLHRIGRKKVPVIPVEGLVSKSKKQNEQYYIKPYKRNGVIVPISSFAKKNIKSRIGLNPTIQIPVGVNTKIFIPVIRKESKVKKILFVGRLIERKGVALVIEAARKFPELNFLLVGTAYDMEDSIFAKNLKRKVIKDNLSNVKFLGKVRQKQVRQLMQGADVLLHPSRIEGIPKVTLEAAATGLPCIVFDDYHTPSVMDSITGFQVKTFDEMIKKLRLLIENRELRLRMGAAAVKHAKKFDWDIIVKQWKEVFEKVVNEKKN